MLVVVQTRGLHGNGDGGDPAESMEMRTDVERRTDHIYEPHSKVGGNRQQTVADIVLQGAN